MAAIRFAENVYSFRATERLFDSAVSRTTPGRAALADIEAKLVTANNEFLARRYLEAITAYNQAAALIYGQINPRFPPEIKVQYERLPQRAELFDAFLSVGLEWMNVGLINETSGGVRPRVQVNADLFGDATKFDQLGIVSTRLSNPKTAGAVADYEYSQTLAEAGNPKAAQFFQARAKEADANAVNVLDKALAPAPVAPVQPPGLFERILRNAGLIGTNANTNGRGTAVTPNTLNTTSDGVLNGNRLVSATTAARTDSQATAVMRNASTLPPEFTTERSFGTLVDAQPLSFRWNAGDAPPLAQVRREYYEARVVSQSFIIGGRATVVPSDLALDLPHLYFYIIPLGLAECYHALGDFARAESLYFRAASYQFLNAAAEAPYVWQRLATLYLDWGNSFFRDDQPEEALPIYSRVITLDAAVPASTLYTTVSLKPGADAARLVIANLDNVLTLTGNPQISAVVVEVWQQVLKIKGGLDYWGFWTNSVPIWTFDYLQNAASNFTQLAITAERDVINFWDRADQATLTRQQISQNVTQSAAEVDAAKLQAKAAEAEATAYGAALELANKRAFDAVKNADEYEATSARSIIFQAEAAQVGGGADGNWDELNSLADRMMAGGTFSDERGTLTGALQLAGSKLSRQYEVAALRRQAEEMALAGTQAQAEVDAANARVAVSAAGVAVASLRAQGAQELLDTFDSQFFTPDVWYRMGQAMWRLYRRYLNMAIRIARMMQRAYNFETDQTLRLIKTDYSTDEVKGLLGAESLMADIQTFTYDLLTSRASKPQPVRQTISLAERYGFAFENQLRKTGSMDFETRIDDFDAYYPGTYAGRLERIEVEVDGIVPTRGISGSLTNAGISAYRLPSSLWTDPETSGLKYRVQAKEALILSDYSERQDALLLTTDQRMRRVFQGAGLASSWRLELPKEINDIDYDALTDVRLTFYYKARFDPDLRERAIAQLASRPGINTRERGIPLRWLYPDAFYLFQDTGELSIKLLASDFRHNETLPVIDSIGVLIAIDGSVSPAGLNVALSTPTNAAVTAQTDAAGTFASAPGNVWAALASGTVLGNYTISLKAEDNPSLVAGGKLNLSPVVNVALVIGYSFTPRV
jgi:hypothetical protein